jgi:hypothetical protein
VADRVTQLAQADVREQRGDLGNPAALAEVELARRGDGVDDPVDDDP